MKYFKTICPFSFYWNLLYLNCCTKRPWSHTFPQYIKANEAEEESISFCRSCCHWNFTELINCPQRDLSDKVCHHFKVLAPFGLSSCHSGLDEARTWVFHSLWKAGAVHEPFLREQRGFTGNKLMKLERISSSVPMSLVL